MLNKELPIRVSARSILVLVVIVLALIFVPWGSLDAGPQALIDQFGISALGNDHLTVKKLLTPADVEKPVQTEQQTPDMESFVEYLQDHDMELEKFVQASVNEDWETVKEMYEPGDVPNDTFELSDDDVKRMVSYWHSHPEELSNLIGVLKQQVQLIENGQGQSAFMKQFDLNIEKSGKSWLFFDEYELTVKPYWVTISANFPNTKLYMNDQEIGTLKRSGQSMVFGPFAPGNYSLKAVVKGGDQPVEYIQPLKLINDQRQLVSVELKIPAGTVRLKSNYVNAEVVLNGKESKRFVGNGLVVGPLALNGSNKVQLQRVFPWGTSKSEVIDLKQSGDLYIPIQPGKEDSIQQRLIATINLYNKSWVSAFSTLDSSKFDKVTDKKRAALVRQLERAKAAGTSYKGKLVKIDYDLNSFQVYMTDKSYVQYLANVDVVETYNDVVEISKSPLRYTLIYVNGEWRVDGSQTIEGLNSSNLSVSRF
jgi:uncharacterized membrane protein YvbJ